MNRAGEKVNKAQLTQNEKCLSEFQRGKLETAFEKCIVATDPFALDVGRLKKAQEKTEKQDRKSCLSLNPPPPFGYTGADTVNSAAVLGARALVEALFDKPVDDADLFTKGQVKTSAACQLAMLKEGDRVEKTAVKEVTKAKKKALKKDGIAGAVELTAVVAQALTGNSKIQKREAKLKKKVDKKCGELSPPFITPFPGHCGLGATLGEVEDCVIREANCLACWKIKTFDALNLDCNGLTGGSCDGP
jgi:hypothetical protein